MMNVHLKNVSDLVSTRLVMYNMYIIFKDGFLKQEWMREATDEVHNGLAIAKVLSTSMQKRLVVENLTLHNLACIDDNSRETLEYINNRLP